MTNVALIGFMGSGKTTVGVILAERLGFTFVDTDKLIEKKTGRSISEIFKTEGEDGFRKIETGVLLDVLNNDSAVVSCGGGIILREENRTALKDGPIVVYLKADTEELFQRVAGTSDKRPLLNVKDPIPRINDMLEEREPLYQSAADITVDTAGKMPGDVAEIIIQELMSKGLNARGA